MNFPDKYDKAISYLKEFPSEIFPAWRDPSTHVCGCLFQYANYNGEFNMHVKYGCLTQIRGTNYKVAATDKLTNEIRQDERIPDSYDRITVDNLHVFAEWQRRLDKELNRV